MLLPTTTWVFWCILLYGSYRHDPASQAVGETSSCENRCGEQSLLIATEFMRLSVDADSVAAAADFDGRPMTMRELKRAAEELGLSCLPLKWDRALDIPPGTVAIVVLRTRPDRPSHYVVVTGRRSGKYQVLDYGQAPMYGSLGTLLRDWDGEALHLARTAEAIQPLSKVAGGRSSVLISAMAATAAAVIFLCWRSFRRGKKLGAQP